MLGAYVPWLVGFSREDARRFYPFMQKNVFDVLRESGYLHIQATKPDTAGNVPSLYPCEHATLTLVVHENKGQPNLRSNEFC